jgi:ELWxxDGT repeat protein
MKKIYSSKIGRPLIVLFLIAMAFSANSQIQLVKDINVQKNREVNEFGVIAGTQTMVFFAADQSLWKSDGTKEGTVMVKKFQIISQMIVFNKILFFVADDGATGMELWRSDGTHEGTVLLRDINPGFAGSHPHDLTIVNNFLMFSATNVKYGRELWRTNGSRPGTTIASDIIRGPESSNPQDLVFFKNKLFFSASNKHGREIWTSTGKSGGTKIFRDLAYGPESSNPHDLTVSGSLLYFVATLMATGEELWKTNGEGSGTSIVEDVHAGSASSSPMRLTNVDGTLYFTADDGLHGREFWKSRGTANNTRLAFDFDGGPASGANEFLAATASANGKLYFVLEGVIYESSGTKATTVPKYTLTDFYNGAQLYVSNDIIYFLDGYPNYGGYETDYTFNKIVDGEVQSIANLGYSTVNDPSMFLTPLGIFFAFGNDNGDYELWKSDGTTAGTAPFYDVVTPTRESNIQFGTVLNGELYFTAQDSTDGISELWKTDGTTEGTMLLKEGTTFLPERSGNWVYFKQHMSDALWKTDGTSAGTTVVADGFFIAKALTDVNGTLFFAGMKTRPDHTSDGIELYKTDGTEANTVLVKDVMPGPNDGDPQNLFNLNGTLYFTALFDMYNRALWMSDGTEAGTVRINAADPSLNPYGPEGLFEWKNDLYFIASAGQYGRELWRSNGTNEGTVMVKDIRQNDFHNNDIPSVQPGTDAIYLIAWDESIRSFLWRSDGTDGGTVKIYDLPEGWIYALLQEYKGKMYFMGSSDTSVQLWVTDGTTEGTYVLKTLSDTYNNLNRSSAIMDGVLYIGGTPYNLFRTDGTECGTFPVSVDPQSTSTTYFAHSMRLLDDQLMFVAYTEPTSYELFKLEASDAPSSPCVSAENVEAAMISGEVNVSGNLKAFPNPFYGEFAFRLNAPEDRPIAVSVVTLEGKTISTFDNLSTNVDYSIGKELPKGLFILKVKDGVRTVSRKIIKTY